MKPEALDDAIVVAINRVNRKNPALTAEDIVASFARLSIKLAEAEAGRKKKAAS